MCGEALHSGISSMKKSVPEIIHLLCPIINAAFHKQSSQGIELLHSQKVSNHGCWNSFLFADVRTKTFHRENDCAYTMITIPKQEMDRNQHPANKPSFLFKINEEQVITLPLMNDVSFFYNASFLTHRQSYLPSDSKCQNKFFNVSSYANKKLFNHLRLSFDRLNVEIS